MSPNGIRTLAGLVTVAVIAAVVTVAVGLFQGSFTESTPVTVLSPRAGLVMNPDAKVEMRGVQVGKVASIESRPDGQAVLHLAMHPDEMHLIPANVLVNLTSPTVFGAKFVELVAPPQPSAQALHAGQILDSQHVTVEVNTLFRQLTSVLGSLDPAKLNETIGAISQALNGRGEKIGQSFSDFNSFLAKFDRSLPALSRDLALTPVALNAYADASPDLVRAVKNSSTISKTLVEEQKNLDTLLASAIGLADVGNDVLAPNRKSFANVMRLLVPTTNLTNQYNRALWCGLAGVGRIAHNAPLSEPSINIVAGLTWGAERYRYPVNLPKVAATGGPQCLNLPQIPFDTHAKVVVTDIGANPVQYGNPQLLLNFDVLKQLLYGPVEGPPRNSAQVGNAG